MSDLTPEKLAELRRLAESVVDTVRTPWYRADELLAGAIESEDDAAYIAALPPATVLELVAAAERGLPTIERSDGWTTVTHPTGGVVLRTRDHEAAVAYADSLEPEPACLLHDCTGEDVRGWEMAECTCYTHKEN